MVMNMRITAFCSVTHWSIVDRYQCFGGTCCFHFHGLKMEVVDTDLRGYTAPQPRKSPLY
jgi:hypothetical protein